MYSREGSVRHVPGAASHHVHVQFWTVGAVLECGLAWITLEHVADDPPIDSGVGWRWLLFYSTLPVLSLYPFIWWLPESPRFLGTAAPAPTSRLASPRLATE
jgi:hypothetical protein